MSHFLSFVRAHCELQQWQRSQGSNPLPAMESMMMPYYMAMAGQQPRTRPKKRPRSASTPRPDLNPAVPPVTQVPAVPQVADRKLDLEKKDLELEQTFGEAFNYCSSSFQNMADFRRLGLGLPNFHFLVSITNTIQLNSQIFPVKLF